MTARTLPTNRLTARLLTGWLLVASLALAACERFPRDPENSLERVLERGALRVGVVENPPWTRRRDDGSSGGVEGWLAEGFAHHLGVEVEWHWGPSEHLLRSLSAYDLDLVVGGFEQANPWRRKVTFTAPYFTSRAVIGMAHDRPAPTGIEGLEVSIRPLSGLAAAIEDEGGIPRETKTLAGSDGLVAGATWELETLGYRPTGLLLRKTEHVLAVPPGENALLLRLEDFLASNGESAGVRARLVEDGGR